MSNELLPSPSNFFSEWGDFGRSGGLNSAVLPSPLTFPTPAEARGTSLASREGEGNGDKRKNSVEAESQEVKRIKT
jgi:transcription factor RLM1